MANGIQSAVVLAVGSELTTGATLDTNSNEIAADLSRLGVEVLYVVVLPDRLERVADAFARAIADADLVVSTGGLGPTPDDLTREAICRATGLEAAVDRDLEAWLRGLFGRRGLEMPESNLKQAWLVPGATGLANANGTAPGWWLELPTASVVVALPGPPREMRPMWQGEVRRRLAERGVGAEIASRTLRLTGIGESALVELVGEEVLRRGEPEVATYARPDAVDLRITARGPGAAERAADVVAQLWPRIERYVFAEESEDWPTVIGRLLAGRTLAVAEIGTAGQVAALLGAEPWFVRGEVFGAERAGGDLAELARRARESAGADLGLAVRATERRADTRVEVAIAMADRTEADERSAFLAGAEGRRRAALGACASLWQLLRRETPGP